MTADKAIEQRIYEIYETLSPSEQQLADVMLQHQQDIASYTATELSAKANVSNATAARLIRRLGYGSVGEARRQARDAQHWGSPLERLGETAEANVIGASVAQMARADIANINMTIESLQGPDLERSIEILRSARRVWIWGVRHGFGLAHHARHYLSFARSDVQVIPSDAALSDDFASMRADDALLVFAFRRRPRFLGPLLAEAKRIGVRIILIGDMSLTKSNKDIDVVIRCWCQSPAPFMSFTVATTVINYLSWALIETLGPDALERLQGLERLTVLADDVGPSKAPRKPKK